MIRKTFILLPLCDVGFCTEEPQWVSFHAAMIAACGEMHAALNQSEQADCAAFGCTPTKLYCTQHTATKLVYLPSVVYLSSPPRWACAVALSCFGK